MCQPWFSQFDSGLKQHNIFQNEEVFVQLHELDKLDGFTHVCISIHLQSHRSTENILV